MTDKTARIILISFFSVLGAVVLFFVIVFSVLKSDAESGYKKASNNISEISHLFNDKKLSNMEKGYYYSNSVDNILAMINYGEERMFIICKLNEYNVHNSKSFSLMKSSIIKRDNVVTYGVYPTKVKPYVAFQSKTHLNKGEKLYVKIDKHTEIKREEHLKKIDVYELRLSEMSFSTALDKTDFIISPVDIINASFAITTGKNGFVCYLLYSLKGEKVELEELLELLPKDIVNIPDSSEILRPDSIAR